MAHLCLKTSILLTCAVLVWMPSGSQGQEVEVEYDRFTDLSSATLTIEPDPNPDDFLLFRAVFAAEWEGDTPPPARGPRKLQLAIFSGARDWQFLDYTDRPVLCIAGEERIGMEYLGRQTDVLDGGYVTEMMIYQAAMDDLARMGEATSLECRVGMTEFSLSPNYVGRFVAALRGD